MGASPPSTEPQPIVVGWDASDGSQRGLAAVAELFPGATVVAASVWEPTADTVALDPVGDALGAMTGIYAELDELGEQVAAERASEGERQASMAGLRAESVVRRGSAANALADIAEERDARLVVVGARRHGRVGAALLGSTSGTLLRRSRRPVLVVPAAAPAERG